MKTLKRKCPPEPDWDSDEDVAAMKGALNRAGYDASNADIAWAWERHSEDWAAQWLTVSKTPSSADGTVKYLLEYLTPIEMERI